MAIGFGRGLKGRKVADLIKHGCLAILEPGADIEGKLTVSSGTARLNSHFKGEIACEGTILVSDRGEVEADIKSKAIIVMGKVKGSVHASERIEIKDRGIILGDVYTPVLAVEPGGYLDGQCHMPTQAAVEPKLEDVVDEGQAT
jgi:cytoskeletal protein CcmA (bactofilin family)